MPSISSRIARVPPAQTAGAWRRHALEVALYVGVYLFYLLTRGLVFSGDAVALANAERIIALEQSLDLFREPAWQQWVLAYSQPLAIFLNWVYIITYWPIILGVALFLYLTRRRTYCYYRNVVLLNLALALALFLLFPLAPPFKTVYLVDTIQLFGPTYYGSPAMAEFYNTNAAMPSLHFSWTCIFGWLFLRELKGWYKVLGLAYPLLTFGSIVITGNHFILDAVAGALLVGVAFAVAGLAQRLTARSAKTS